MLNFMKGKKGVEISNQLPSYYSTHKLEDNVDQSGKILRKRCYGYCIYLIRKCMSSKESEIKPRKLTPSVEHSGKFNV